MISRKFRDIKKSSKPGLYEDSIKTGKIFVPASVSHYFILELLQ